MHRKFAATATLAVAAVITVLVSTPANVAFAGSPGAPAAPPGVNAREWAQIRWQDATASFRDNLAAAARQIGYAGADLDADTSTLTVFSTGDPSPAVQHMVEHAPAGLVVRWRHADFTAAQLDEAAQAFEASAGADVYAVTPANDYSGLVVQTAGVAAAAASPKATSGPSYGAPVPVTFQHVDAPPAVPVDAGRAGGSAPFHGGSRIERDDFDMACSTAVKVLTASGNAVMLTAQHCTPRDVYSLGISGGYENVGFHLMRDSTSVGHSTGVKSQPWDVQAIDGKSYDSGIWMGGSTTSQVLRTVSGSTGSLGIGEYVTLSGGFSGTISTTTVTNTDYDFRFCTLAGNSFCNWHRHFIVVADSDKSGDPISGAGDSGGPALQYASDGQSVLFGGVISAGRTDYKTSTCPGITMIYGQPRDCYSRMVISPWSLFHTAGEMDLHLP